MCYVLHIVKMPRSTSLSNFTSETLGNTKLNLAISDDFRINLSSIIITAVLILSNSTL